jgi:hypothetical protein
VTRWTSESLRRAALDALGPLGSELAREALVHGAIDVRPSVTQWEASAGRVDGHRVTIGLDDTRLAQVRRDHSAYDALCAAIASAIATQPGESLFELTVEPAVPGMTETPYRGRRP